MARRLVRYVPLALVAVFALVMLGEQVMRTTIPRGIDGSVTYIDVRFEDQPGVDDVWFVTVDAEAIRMEKAVAERLTVGDSIEKRAWSRTITVNGTEYPVAMSPEARSGLWFSPLLILVAVVMTRVTATVRASSRLSQSEVSSS